MFASVSDSKPSLARPLSVVGALLVVGLAAWWWVSSSSDPAAPGSSTSGAPEVASAGGGGFDDPEIVASAAARRRADGGASSANGADEPPAAPGATPEGAYDPPLPTLGVEEPMHQPDPDAPPVQPPPSRNTAPITPEQELGRTVFWRGMLDSRITELRRQLAQAEELGDDPAVRRAQVMLERLEAQRPRVEERIEELQAQTGQTRADEP